MKFELKSWAPALTCSLCLVGTAVAADAPMAVVNGVSIPTRLLSRTVDANVAQGQKDTPELRAVIKQELIARELMSQEAQKRGLDKLQTTQDALHALRQNLLIEALLNNEFTKSPLTDSELRVEYERQVKVINSAGELQQYQISIIAVASEAQARTVLTELRSGQSFDALAKTKSLDPSKGQGGALGWLLPDQMTASISNVVVNLAEGALSAAPIQVGPYWHVVKLSAKRAYQVPAFEDSKGLLQTAMLQARRSALLQKLTESAVLK